MSFEDSELSDGDSILVDVNYQQSVAINSPDANYEVNLSSGISIFERTPIFSDGDVFVFDQVFGSTLVFDSDPVDCQGNSTGQGVLTHTISDVTTNLLIADPVFAFDSCLEGGSCFNPIA